MATTAQSLGKVPPPLLRSLQKLNGGSTNQIGSGTPLSPRSFATETTAKSSVTEEEMIFMLMEASQDDGSLFESPVRNMKQPNKNLWRSVPNLSFDPNESPSAASTTWDFAGFDDDKTKKAPKSISVESDHVQFSRRNTVAALQESKRSSLTARPTTIVRPAEIDRLKPTTIKDPASEKDFEAKVSKTIKKKRIKVRASDLSLDSSGGSSVDRQQVQEAVRRWQSEHSVPSTDGDLSAMQRSVQRRRSSTDDHVVDSSQCSGTGHFRVVIRRTKSLDDSSTMNHSLNSNDSRLARPKRRTRSKSRGRMSRTGTPSLDHEPAQEKAKEGDSKELSPKLRSRSMSRGRRSSSVDGTVDMVACSPKRSTSTRRTRSRSRVRPTATSGEGHETFSPTSKARSKSLGRHFQESNHESQARDKADRSCARSVSQRSAVSAPSRVGTRTLLQRRRSRSLARPPSRLEETTSSPVQAPKPVHREHPMNDLSRNRQPGDITKPGSAAFQSKYAAVEEQVQQPKAAEFAEEQELIRLIQETGITPEQFLKLREAGYMLTPEE